MQIKGSSMMEAIGMEAPRVSLFRAQLRSVLETLLNDALTEITRVYVDSSVVTTMEEEDSPQDQSSPSCKTHIFAPEVPASPPHRAVTPDVPFKEEGLESEPHPPFQQPQIILVTSLARKDAYTQIDSSSFHLQPPNSTTPLKDEVLEVGTLIDQEQAEIPEPLNADAGEQVSHHAQSPGEDIPNEDGSDEEQLDTDQDQVVSREDSQERVATQQETCEQLVLRARSIPRRPRVAKRKAGCNLRVKGTKMNPDQTSQMSQMSCSAASSLTQTSEYGGIWSIKVEVPVWDIPNEDGLDEEQLDNMEDERPPGPSALKENADTDQTLEHAKRLKSCSVQLVKVNPFACHICSKTFKGERFLRRHLRFHTGEKPYLCEQCGRRFALKVNFKKHLKKHDQTVHNNEESPTFRCEYCVKQFCSKMKLDVHVRVHTGEKPHHCVFCKRKHYRLKKNLIKHMLKHLGYAPAVDQKRKLHK